MKAQDIADLKQLIEFLKEHQVGEFEVDRGDLKIKLKFKDSGGGAMGAGDLARLMAAVPQAAPVAAPAAAAPAAAAAKPAEDSDADLHMVKSPIVGTYYGSPSLGASPFVAVGDKVDKGQVICIVEAMKLMNEIESDAAGEIVKCFVTNGQAIEYGQPLFSIRAS